jgi:hypothetical protein
MVKLNSVLAVTEEARKLDMRIVLVEESLTQEELLKSPRI